jgi:PAS domain S-box-containing protein
MPANGLLGDPPGVSDAQKVAIRHRLAQQAAVSALGSLSLAGRPIAELLEEAARVLHGAVDSDLIMVLETTAEGGISIRASAGEVPPLPPVSSPPPDLRRTIGLVRDAGETLLSPDLASETYFQAPGLEAAGMASLVAAPIGSGETAFGELVACSRQRAAFSEDDLAFVESIANVLMAALERDRAVVRMAVAESRMSEFWELSHDLLAVFTPEGRFLEVSGSWERELGWTPAELIGRIGSDLVVPEDRPAAVEHTASTADLDTESVLEVVNRFQAKDGTSRWLLWSVQKGSDGTLYTVAKDITGRYEQQELSAQREEQLNDAQRLARMGSWEIDFASGRHTLSENMRAMLALNSCNSNEAEFMSRVHPEDRKRMKEVLANGQRGEFRVLLPDGRVRDCSSHVRKVHDEAGLQTGIRGTVEDVTDALQAEAALRRSEERFRQGFDNAPIAMALTNPSDLRYLRANNAFCSMVGRTRQELEELTFMDISHPDDVAASREVFEQLQSGERDHYAADKRFVRADGSEVWASVSITTVREADGGIDVLFGQMVDITERKAREASLLVQLDEITWLEEIRRAFEEDRFELHAQPIVDLATGETVQRELLIRMRDPDGKLIPPGLFLPAAEKHGAIRAIDRWVLAQGADLAAKGIDVEINISAASIGDPGLVADIEREIKRTGADPSRLVFEITETAMVEETEVAVTLAERLRHLGCRFALDDFGSGYGGFHYLKHLPMDFLKIDREFVGDAHKSEADQHVLHAIVGLARGFGLKTIAEGVEDQETLDMLKEYGFDYAQGYFLGRPAPLSDHPDTTA